MAGKALKTNVFAGRSLCCYMHVCLFAITEAVKNNNCNLLQCGTSLCGLIGFEMPLLIFVHLQFKRLHKNKHDTSALSFCTSVKSIDSPALNSTVIVQWKGHILWMCVSVHVMFKVCLLKCVNLYMQYMQLLTTGFGSWEDHFDGVCLPQLRLLSHLIPSSEQAPHLRAFLVLHEVAVNLMQHDSWD